MGASRREGTVLGNTVRGQEQVQGSDDTFADVEACLFGSFGANAQDAVGKAKSARRSGAELQRRSEIARPASVQLFEDR